jgi:phage minor structural protein
MLIAGNYIIAKPNPYSAADWFHIYRVSKSTSRIVSVYAEHITYAANHFVCFPDDTYAEEPSQPSMLAYYMNEQVYNNPHTGPSIGFSAETFEYPRTWSVGSYTEIRNVMSMAATTFGGEWIFSGTSATLVQRRGADRNVELSNATNLVSLTSDMDISDVYTYVFPYWKGTNEDGEEETVYSDPAFIPISLVTPVFKAYIYDCSNRFMVKPTESELYYEANNFIYANYEALVSYVTSFDVEVVQRGRTIEGAHLTDADHIEIGDTIHINLPDVGIQTTSRVMATRYDALRDRLISVSLGSRRASITDTFAKVKNKEEKEELEKEDKSSEDSGSSDTEEAIPDKVVRVSDNEVQAYYHNYSVLVTWTADGEGNERHNFSKSVSGYEPPEPEPDDEDEDEDINA